MCMIPVSMLEDVFKISLIAWWIYELFHLRACCQRFRVGDKVVHRWSGRQGEVSAVYWISEKLDITMPFSLEASTFWCCIICDTKNYKWRMYCRGCGTHAMYACGAQPDFVTERRIMAAWKKKEGKCMKFRLIALLALTLVYIWQKLAYPVALAIAIQYLEGKIGLGLWFTYGKN